MCCVHTGQDLLQSTPGQVKGRTYANSFPKKLGFLHKEPQERKKICLSMAKKRVTVDPQIFVELYLNLNISCVVLLQHLAALGEGLSSCTAGQWFSPTMCGRYTIPPGQTNWGCLTVYSNRMMRVWHERIQHTFGGVIPMLLLLGVLRLVSNFL